VQELVDAMVAFLGSNSLAERISVAQAMIIKFSEDIDDVAGFFDYKQGLATKGNPSRYATLYAVNALADLFERHNRVGLKSPGNFGKDLTSFLGNQKVGEIEKVLGHPLPSVAAGDGHFADHACKSRHSAGGEHHVCAIIFQLAEVAVTGPMVRAILTAIRRV
jgi:hypothetical protein